MSSLLLASHGSLAEGMITAMDMILGKNHTARGYGLDTYENPDQIAAEIEKVMAENPDTYLLLTDIKGGSVYNELLKFGTKKNVYILSGMNLPLCLELALLEDQEQLTEKIQMIVDNSRMGIEAFYEEKMKNQQLEDDELW